MKEDKVTRRSFIRDTSLTAAGVVAGVMASKSGVAWGSKKSVDTSKILNYNPNMEYRRLGKTELMVSAVCLGGHWKRVNVMRQDFDENRYEVVSRCIEVGINYLDACWGGEVKAYCKALKGRREQMYLALSNGSHEARYEGWRTKRKLLMALDELLRDSNQEYTDLWRITCLETGSKHSFDTSCEIVAAMEDAKKQGKARHVGFSTHDRRWVKFMVEHFPQVEVVLFPYTARTKRMPKDSVFDALEKCDVGAFGIKPFAGASLFEGTSAPNDPKSVEDNRRARQTLRYILCNPRIIPIPGLISPQQVDNIAKAVMERRELDAAEARQLEELMEETWAKLPPHYQWLKDWEYV
jgi:predicted aldo/keto reductase-like oxidoreductase